MGRGEQQIEHLLRRAGFGRSPDEIDLYAEILDLWLGSNSVAVLGGDFRSRLGFL